jgi:hypothetical protein
MVTTLLAILFLIPLMARSKAGDDRGHDEGEQHAG